MSISSSKIQVTVPESLTRKKYQISLNSSGKDLVYAEPFSLKPPIITHFSPETVLKPRQVIIIEGANFNPMRENNLVYIESFRAEVLSSSKNTLEVYLPDETIPVYNQSEFKDIPIDITVAEQSTTAPKQLKVHWHSTWTRKNDFPGAARRNAVAFSIGDKGYFGTGTPTDQHQVLKDFWEYDPYTDQWTQIDDLPGKARGGAVAFSIDNKGYVGLGVENFYSLSSGMDPLNDMYSYDPATGLWSEIRDLPSIGRRSAGCFVLENEAYVVAGWWDKDDATGRPSRTKEAWKYKPSSNSWNEITEFPDATDYAVGLNVGNRGFIYDFDKLYEYINNAWVLRDAIEMRTWGNQVAFSIGNLAFIGLGYPVASNTNILWQFDVTNGTFTERSMGISNGRFAASAFVINGKAYIIGGKRRYGDVLGEVWEFDPSKPEE